ncbi:MAG: thermonuclease family protein [Magnetococcales bacterium]|nr:thermonuclease family protein [Magnetococcales bacterium]
MPFAIRCCIFFQLTCWLLPSGVLAGAWSGEVVRVTDGDTLVVARGGERVKIRVAGIDTPEHGQPFAQEAKAFTVRHVGGRMVRVVEKEMDRYHRVVGWVTPADGGEELGSALVRAGLAWRHIHFSKDPELMALERAARKRRIGIWSQPDPIPPWVWKHPR